MSAYVINVFFFFQLVSLIHVKAPNLSGDENHSDNVSFNLAVYQSPPGRPAGRAIYHGDKIRMGLRI